MCASLIVVLLAACAREEPVAVSIDLTTYPRGFKDSEMKELRIEERGTARWLVQEQRGFVDLYVRLPSEPQLRWQRPADVEGGRTIVSVTVGEHVETLDPTSRDGTWSATMPGRAGEIARVRLASVAAQSSAWIEPHVVGFASRSPPVLTPQLRPREQPVNVILYVVDTLRADRLSLYGYDRPTSPCLEQLGTRAVVFANAYAAGSYTPSSMTAMFASRFPSELGGRLDPKGPAQQTIAEVFQAAGYATAGFQANVTLVAGLGYARGFEHYELLSREGPLGVRGMDAEGLHARMLTWLREKRGDRPFFAYLQSMDVHFPYDAPPSFLDRFPPRRPTVAADAHKLEQMRAQLDEEQIRKAFEAAKYLDPERYDAGVAYADHEICVLLAALERDGLADRTVVLITADHGEPLGDRGELIHGRSLFEELVRVPLVLRVPNSSRGVRVDEVVSLLDVAPTLADLAGLPIPAQFVGRSWLEPRTSLQPPAAVGELFSERNYNTVGWYAREGPWKVIVDPAASPSGYQLYYLPSDPKETTDVSAAHPFMARYLVGRATRRPARSTTAVGPVDQGLSEAERHRRNEALRALGYVE